MIFTIEKDERQVFDLVAKSVRELKSPAYVVGGYVRDRLLARPSKDMDIVTLGSGIHLAHQVANGLSPRPKVTEYSRFGVAMIRYGDLEIEFVGARKESYRYDSRKPEVETGSLEDDQNRRDFTINALAVSLNQDTFGEIIDPFGGLHHLEEKILKTPLEPGRTFSDDPLRMLRAIRFSAQLDFEIEDETLRAISKYRNRIHIVSQERITGELEKILATDRPSVGFKLLFSNGLLQIILPELAALQGVDVRDGQAHKDNFYHTLQVVDNLCARSHNIWLRWATLLHDIAKPATKRFVPGEGWTFHGHEALGGVMVPRIFKKLRLPMDDKMRFVQKMVQLHRRPVSLCSEEISDSALRRLLFDAGDDIDELMLLCQADITSKIEQKKARILQGYQLLMEKLRDVEARDHLRNWQPPITGEIIMDTFGLPPSREVGVIKTAVREAILDGLIPNEMEAAFARMVEEGKKLGLVPK